MSLSSLVHMSLRVVALASIGVSSLPAQESEASSPLPPEPGVLLDLVEEFGERYSVKTTDHWFIVSRAEEDFVEQTARILEKTRKVFLAQFEEIGFQLDPPRTRLICVLIGDHEEFVEYVRSTTGREPQAGGFYSGRTNRITFFDNRTKANQRSAPRDDPMSRNISKSAHEAGHQLAFNCGVQKVGAAYPTWVGEGLASNFEPRSFEDDFGPLGAKASNRLGSLETMRRRGALLDLGELIQMRRGGEEGTTGVLYAQGAALFRFLAQERPKELVRYMGILARRSGGRPRPSDFTVAFVEAFGPIDEIEEAWQQYLEKLLEKAGPSSGR